ncbi:MAG: hypothetical protein Tsb0017_25240 [Geothermobacteraceae bacterium]
MKLKANHSNLFEEAAAKTIIAIFAGILIFICSFAVWSALCMGGAVASIFS